MAQRSIELRPKPDEPHVVATFPFTNAGKEPVTITSLKTSCDCTTASLAKHTYAPGESGSITATFTVGGRTGPQTKTILVLTTDKAEGTVLLTMRVHLPEVLTLTPRFVFWPVGGKPEPKTVKLRVNHPTAAVKVLSVKGTSPVMVPELKTVEEGKEYLVTLTSNETDRTLRASHYSFMDLLVAAWSISIQTKKMIFVPTLEGVAGRCTSDLSSLSQISSNEGTGGSSEDRLVLIYCGEMRG